MAAKQPMPPGNSNVNGQNQQQQTATNSSNNNNTSVIAEALNKHFQQKQQTSVQAYNNNNNIYNDNDNETEQAATKSKLTCSCTNISIMHLFHEMKQEFPTIPDAIVTQCVNENCHQRENCIQMLKKELALHPIPVQSYPAKVLQQQQQQVSNSLQRQTKPPTPLKPSRVAPLQPSAATSLSSPVLNQRRVNSVPNCDNEVKQQEKDVRNSALSQTSNSNSNHNQNSNHINANGSANADMPITTNTTTTSETASTATPTATSTATPTARARPTTLNLNGSPSSELHQQQRQLNAQLQQKIQQRQRQQQQQTALVTSHNKPLRKAPLPPLPPKPHAAGSGGPVSLAHTQQSSFSTDSSCLTSPMSSSESEISVNVSLSSPTAAAAALTAAQQQQASPIRHRSVITLQTEPPYTRYFQSNPNVIATAVAAAPNLSPTPSSCASSPVAAGRKSFTSLNLTLRQPNPNTGVAQSAIDISAGPAPSGAGTGITYSSSSFDARRGTHKNFHLTVTDEGSVFSAGCVRSQPQLYADNETHTTTDGPRSPKASSPCSLSGNPFAQQQQHSYQQYQPVPAIQMPEIFPYPTQPHNHIVPSNYISNHLHSNNSADNSPSGTHSQRILYADNGEESDQEAHRATIERQKMKRDKLANALRGNKKKLYELEQEINILTDPVPVGASERLDREIKKLTADCERLLYLTSDPNVNGAGQAQNSMHRQSSVPTTNSPNSFAQPQPFPRQRSAGTRVQAPPNSLRLNSLPAQSVTQLQTPNLDFVQHHSSAPTSACITPQQSLHDPPPSYAHYQQYMRQRQLELQQQQQQQQQQQNQSNSFLQPRSSNDDEEYLSGSDIDEDEEPLDMWACNLCTFRNHPQLNICEACENVRIKPGTIRIVPSSGNANPNGATPSAAAAAGLETDSNLTNQLQQQYALHT